MHSTAQFQWQLLKLLEEPRSHYGNCSSLIATLLAPQTKCNNFLHCFFSSSQEALEHQEFKALIQEAHRSLKSSCSRFNIHFWQKSGSNLENKRIASIWVLNFDSHHNSLGFLTSCHSTKHNRHFTHFLHHLSDHVTSNLKSKNLPS